MTLRSPLRGLKKVRNPELPWEKARTKRVGLLDALRSAQSDCCILRDHDLTSRLPVTEEVIGIALKVDGSVVERSSVGS